MSQTAPQDPLDAGEIRKGMAAAALSGLRHLTVLSDTDSTNSAIIRMPGDRQHAHAVLADQQTGGRGRRQRTWHSPAGGNIHLSLGWCFSQCDWPLSTLPLGIAVAVCRALSRAGLQGHGIKWPNDILVGEKKLAGILVEAQSSGRGLSLAVAGVGLNVRMPRCDGKDPDDAIDRPWTDLATELKSAGAGISRNRIAALLLEELLVLLDGFESNGFESFSTDWRERDLLQGRKITLEYNGRKISGEARGVDNNGGLLLRTGPGDMKIFHSGEVSVNYG
jgi:BirA family biotin operon repressor/biotin-[acetyl-CoA-carboxylase] ligase